MGGCLIAPRRLCDESRCRSRWLPTASAFAASALVAVPQIFAAACRAARAAQGMPRTSFRSISKMCDSRVRRFYETPDSLSKPAAQKENAFRLHGTHIKNGHRVLEFQEALRTGVPN